LTLLPMPAPLLSTLLVQRLTLPAPLSMLLLPRLAPLLTPQALLSTPLLLRLLMPLLLRLTLLLPSNPENNLLELTGAACGPRFFWPAAMQHFGFAGCGRRVPWSQAGGSICGGCAISAMRSAACC
jgi:hypothetical protein